MNMIVCRHPNDSGKYIFRVPADVTIDAGTLLTVETSRGVQPAQAMTSSFMADPHVICPLWNTTPQNMKRVLSFMIESAIEWPHEPKQPKYDDDEEP